MFPTRHLAAIRVTPKVMIRVVMKTLIGLVLLAFGLTGRVALAQADAGLSAEIAADTPVAEVPNSLQPDSERIGLLQSKVESLEEQFAETNVVVKALSKIKFSGYVQARYQYAENSLPGVDTTGNPLVKDGFSVRRARLKTEYQGTVARYMLQIDAIPGPTGFVIRDAEAGLTEPWTGKSMFGVTAGITKWPFGYETVQSSNEREFPERTRMIRAFFNGERDRGIKFNFKYGPMRAWLGVFDGNGMQNKGFAGVDNDVEKDFYGRIAADFKFIAFGVSGSTGKTFRPANGTNEAHYFSRDRIGADAQVYLDLLPFGSTAIKAEFVAGHTYQSGNVEKFGVPALGWYALLVQNIGSHEQVGFRYDFFDPLAGTPNVADATDSSKPGSNNQVQTFGFLVTHYFDEVLKVSLVYEIPLVITEGTTASPPHQNLLTLQLQAKF